MYRNVTSRCDLLTLVCCIVDKMQYCSIQRRLPSHDIQGIIRNKMAENLEENYL